MVVGMLRVPALAGDSRGRDIDLAPVAFAAALVALGGFRHAALWGGFCRGAMEMKGFALFLASTYSCGMVDQWWVG